MDTITLKKDVYIFGLEVHDSPEGIGEAFDILVRMVDRDFRRSYYGICEMKAGTCSYKAAAEETFEDEGSLYACDRYIIEEGEYLAVTIRDWRKKTDTIKDVFFEMMRDDRIDRSQPFVEWYKDDDEMICMVKVSKESNKKMIND
jgi:hypothetical protein